MQLIFVYNAKSGKLNKYLDIGHKLISPKTYQCSLCALTHDTFSENEVWTKFRTSSAIDMGFLHSDEFEKTYPKNNFSYPIILKEVDNKLSPFINSEALDKIEDLNELIRQIDNVLSLDLSL